MFVERKQSEPSKPISRSDDDDPEKREVNTYEELTIKVLDILDKQGVNIYDENRYGGMYLKQKTSDVSEIFNSKTETNNEEAEPTVASDDIINFFSR